MNPILRIGTDCSGIEAPVQALLQLNIPYVHTFSSEIDKYVIQTCKANYTEPLIRYTDLTSRDHALLPDIDMYVCGFPCQSFSTMGKQLGTSDPRGSIMLHCINVIKVKQPKFFILENVRGFMTNEKGETLKFLVKSLEESGYTVHWKLLNTKNFGLPQTRPRVYFVGIRKDLDISFSFPETPMEMESLDNILVDHTKYEKVHLSKSLQKHYDKVINKDDNNWLIIDSGFASVIKDCCPTLTTNCHSIFMTKYNRKLTSTECLKLQGFPEDFKHVVSNSQLYRQAGNTMSVPILKYIIRNLVL